MNSMFNKDILIIFMALTVSFLAISFITMPLIIFIVRKNIEKRLKIKIEFPFYTRVSPWGFLGKYSGMAGLIAVMYLTEKSILKKTKYFKDIYLVKLNYTTINENKINIVICFLHVISLFLMFIFLCISFYIGSHVYKT